MNGSPRVGPYADPTGNRTAVLLEKYAAPDVVLDADITQAARRPEFGGCYADPGRAYPIHTPAAAWLSAACYHDAGVRDEKIAAEISTALLRHRLWGEWERLEKAAACESEKRASEVRHRFALRDRYPLDTPADVVRAVDYFDKYANEFSRPDRTAYAAAVVGAITDYGVPVAPDKLWRLEAESGAGAPNNNWKRAVETRKKLAADCPEAAAALDLVREYPADPLDLVDILREMDKTAGWDLPDPLTEIVGDTPSTAAEKLAGVVPAAGGRWYARDDVMRVPDFDISVAVPGTPMLVYSLEKRAELLSNPDTAGSFEELLAHHSVQPVSAARPRTDWAALAAS